MAGGVITVSRRKYAAGLFWQPMYMHESARENAVRISRMAKMHASLFVAFNGMIGLANRAAGGRANMPAAAPDVMESFGVPTFLAAFSVAEGIWLLAVRGGIVIKDKVFLKSDDARKDYDELNAMPDWSILVAPADWNAPSAVERKLSDIMTGNRKYNLANISRLPGYVMTVLLFAVFCIAGYNLFEEPIKKIITRGPQNVKIDQKVAEEYKKRLAQINAPKVVPKKVIHVPLPYETLPVLSEKVEQCWKAVAFLSQQITGWVQESVVCENGQANAHLARTHGTVADLYSEISQKMPGAVILETGGSDAIVTAKLRSLRTISQKPAFATNDVMTAVQSVFQRIKTDVDFRRDFYDLKIPKLGANEILDTNMTEIPVVKIDATSKMRPQEFAKIVNDVTPVEMPVIKWDNRGRNWIYEVIIYPK